MDRIYLIDLYDIYSDLLNDKQREYFELYYFDNLSLGEISDNIGISRNAIYKQIKTVENKIIFFEDKLAATNLLLENKTKFFNTGGIQKWELL